MNVPRRPSPDRRVRLSQGRRHRARRTRFATLAAVAALALLAAGCARFPASAPSFSAQPSLTPNVATLVTPTPQAASSSSTPPPSSAASGSVTTPPTTSSNPCAPSMPPVIATCLTAPWGLAPLPDGQSALVGERTTGKILKVAPGKKPTLVATVTGLDTSGGGGLLGIALSPYYAEDNLIYAYVTTKTDNRILRIAPGQRPKAIFTGIPRGDKDNGGSIAFGSDDMLYVATGDAGDPGVAAQARSLAGKVLRLDTFGKPAQGNKSSSAVYASGFTDPTGICPLPGGAVGILDHRPTGDMLIPAGNGKDYANPRSGDALWIYQAGDGGAVDCAVSGGYLLASSLAGQKVTGIQMTPTGGFTGSPENLAVQQFGRLRTIITGPGDLVWLTTSNKDGHGHPSPSDDRVVVLPAGGGGGGGGSPE